DKSMVHGDYEGVATNTLRTAQHEVQGSFVYDQGLFSTSCMIDTDELCAEVEFDPEYGLHHFSYKDKEKKELIIFQATEDKKTVHGSVTFPFIRSLINNMMSYDIQGEGNLAVVAQINFPEIIADVSLKDATIRLPQTYNFI